MENYTMILYLCSVCDRTHMTSYHGGVHSDRTGHKIVIQTPEAILQYNYNQLRMTKEQIKQAVEKVESKLAAHIIGPEHLVDCRCLVCWNKFQYEWSKGDNK